MEKQGTHLTARRLAATAGGESPNISEGRGSGWRWEVLAALLAKARVTCLFLPVGKYCEGAIGAVLVSHHQESGQSERPRFLHGALPPMFRLYVVRRADRVQLCVLLGRCGPQTVFPSNLSHWA